MTKSKWFAIYRDFDTGRFSFITTKAKTREEAWDIVDMLADSDIQIWLMDRFEFANLEKGIKMLRRDDK